MLTLDKLADEVREFHNDVCIYGDAMLVRLVGVAEDKDDLYYILRQSYHTGEYSASAVGPIVSLRPIYPAERYENLDKALELNGAPKSDKFIVRHDWYPHNG